MDPGWRGRDYSDRSGRLSSIGIQLIEGGVIGRVYFLQGRVGDPQAAL